MGWLEKNRRKVKDFSCSQKRRKAGEDGRRETGDGKKAGADATGCGRAWGQGEAGGEARRREKRVSKRELVKETSPVAGSGERELVTQATRLEEVMSW